jgi:cellulose synthase/poly-beta-1,6-N-acetylglucosamine synthase-like glycosyltransferase
MFGLTEILQNVIYFISLYYVVFWLIVLLDKTEKKPKTLKEYPEVTIIIPAYNEQDNIIDTIRAVENLDYPKNKISLFVVDDGSKDNTLKLAKKYCKNIKGFNQVIVLTQKNQGKHAAMNNALKYVKTEFFSVLDADSMPETNALKRIMCTFKKDVAAVSPVLKVYKPQNMIQTIQWFEYSVNHFYKSVITKINAIHVVPGPLSTYRTKIVREIGGFRDAHKTEDMEIAMRIQQANYRIIQCDDAFVHTKAPYTFKQLYRQRMRWNYGTLRNLIDYRKMMFNRKYGDFGMFQLPIILLSGIMGITILGLIIFDTIKSIKPNFRLLQLYNFNIIKYIQNTQLNIIWLDLDAKSIVTFGGFFIITLIVIWLSLRIYKEKYDFKNSWSFFFYIMFYYLFLSIVWMGVFRDLIIGKHAKWRK